MAYGPHYIRAWRKHRKLTLEKVVELVGDLTTASLSRIERSQQPYNQGTLEALAGALRCSPADLLAKDPKDAPDELGDLLKSLPPHIRAQAIRLIRALQETSTSDAA